MDRVERRAAVVAQVERQRERLIASRPLEPPCLFCIHGPAKSSFGLCSHPIFLRVDGKEVKDALMTTAQARSENGLCGPEALLYEERNVVARVMRSLRFSRR